MGQRILFLGVYGMEIVECGGALAINAQKGGQSFASVMLAKEMMKTELQDAATVLGINKLYFNDFERGGIDLRKEYKVELVRVIRETKPDIIITQCPEHSYEDLDPDRRPAMMLILESIALASRDFALAELPDLAPHPVATIYYMNPKTPNCSISLASVMHLKNKAMDCLTIQMQFSGEHFSQCLSQDERTAINPQFDSLSFVERGRAVQQAIDNSLYFYNGIGSHSKFVIAEPYRRHGIMELEELMP
ncbi:GlcNAc-PI de-N-acetylase [Shewanella sp. 1CM18E]|uniref:PIG-L deacetylase family protein n=1 Tax=Shewanella sp. 1CM18E TaxID=2929169 RepID=UPI0020C04F33|nr:PIG-L family deacetylase [Shewanella sp. 1CM18E]MCK8046448.1 GlcNAc-PI de-N-acetylase [Shewanella sp. 1CM18E]